MSMNVYQMVTDRFIAELEKGIIPWQKPWKTAGDVAFNRVSKKPYSLLNQLMLKHSGDYATFKQWSDMGGKVKKGEKAEVVVFWKMMQVADEVTKDGESEAVIKTIPLLRYFQVFHISQVDGVEPLDKAILDNQIEKCEDVEDIVADYLTRENIPLHCDELSNRAFYSPKKDSITVPNIKQFDNASEYYATLFHEMVHSTGHPSRLDRFDLANLNRFGSEGYSKEELIAEIGSACIMTSLGIDTENTFKNSAGYVQGWLKVLKDDNKLIVSAASKAEKAVEYIVNEEACKKSVA